jgi:hypothetical protein
MTADTEDYGDAKLSTKTLTDKEAQAKYSEISIPRNSKKPAEKIRNRISEKHSKKNGNPPIIWARKIQQSKKSPRTSLTPRLTKDILTTWLD